MSVWAPGVWASPWADGVWFGMGGGPEPEVASTDTSDLTPWDFLQQFEIQKRQWLRARSKLEAAKALEKVYQELPPEQAEQIDVPLAADEPEPTNLQPRAMPRIDYQRLMRSAEVVDQLLTLLLKLQQEAEDDDMAVIVAASL